VRAALCADAETARGARRWNDANVVGLSLRLTTASVAFEVVDAFLATPVDAGEQRLIGRLDVPSSAARSTAAAPER
jgi:ribose 5-phosphate isomerase B